MQLTVRDTARILNTSEKTIYRWIRQGALPAYRVNEQYRFNRAELLEWATSRRMNVSAELFEEPESSSTPLPSLAGAIRAGGIIYRLEGKDKASVLQSLVNCMPVPPEVDRDFLYRVLLARESLGSTAIGDGIAIPHVRNPIVLHVSEPMVTLCFLEQPIDFGAMDGQPVGVLFSLISPTVRAHLHLLSRLAFVLRDERLKALLREQGSRETILAVIREIESGLAAKPPFPSSAPKAS